MATPNNASSNGNGHEPPERVARCQAEKEVRLLLERVLGTDMNELAVNMLALTHLSDAVSRIMKALERNGDISEGDLRNVARIAASLAHHYVTFSQNMVGTITAIAQYCGFNKPPQ